MLLDRLRCNGLPLLFAAFGLPFHLSGQHLAWVNDIGGVGYDEARGLTVGPNGDVYLTGEFEDTVDFDPGPGSYELASAGQTDAFLACYGNGGGIKWAAALGGSLASQGYGITITPAGGILTTGIFTGTVDLDPGPAVLPRTSMGAYDIYLCAFDADGTLQWADVIGGPDNDETRSVATDGAGNAYIAGELSGTTDADPGSGYLPITTHGSFDALIAKYDANGALVWAHALGGQGDDRGYDLAVRADGSAFITGYYADTVDFDPGPGTSVISTPSQWSNGFLACFDPGGQLQWVNDLGGDGTDSGRGVVVDPLGNVVMTGRFARTMTLGNGADTVSLACSGWPGDPGDADVFMAKFDPFGQLMWACGIGGDQENMPRGIATDLDANIFVTGRTRGTIDLDPGPGTAWRSAAGEFDAFLAKYDTDGQFEWGFTVGNTEHERGLNVATDAAGSAFITGWIMLDVDFDPGPDTSMAYNAGDMDAFLAKYSDDPLTDLLLTIAMDGQPEEVTWAVIDTTGPTPMFSGTGAAPQAGLVVTTHWEVPAGCYRLVVHDQGANGLMSDGYVLHTTDAPIIDASGSFADSSAIAAGGGFCLPLGPASLTSTTCAEYLMLPTSVLNITPVTDATAFDLWFFDPHGSHSSVVTHPLDQLPVSQLPAGIPSGIELNVRVRALVDGTLTGFGPVCALLLDQPTGSGAVEDMNPARIVPNPCQRGIARITMATEGDDRARILQVRDAMGRLLLEERVFPAHGWLSHPIDLSQVNSGLYLVTLLDDRRAISLRLVVE